MNKKNLPNKTNNQIIIIVFEYISALKCIVIYSKKANTEPNSNPKTNNIIIVYEHILASNLF